MAKDVNNGVLNYLESVNRPYSFNDICQNMHNEFSKSAVQKALDHLVGESKIREKVYNKQKIYSIVQESTGEDGESQKAMQECELEIMQKTEILKNLEVKLKSTENELGKRKSTLSLKEAKVKKGELQASIEKLEKKLTESTENKISISETDRNKIEKDYNNAVKAYKTRKRICTEILNSILENCPKKKSVLVEEIGLELDDETNTPPLQK